MISYDFLEAMEIIMINVWTDLNWPNYIIGKMFMWIGI